jgi:glycosyltransferase involved in cell wall biosynthesis
LEKGMNVLHVIDRMDPERGGVCQAVRTIAHGLDKHGVLSEIVSLDSPDASFLDTDSFTIHALGPANNPWSYGKNLLPWLCKNISNFDVVIVHGLWQYPTYAMYKALTKTTASLLKINKKGKSTKLFVMPHGMLDPYFQKAEGRKLKALRNVLYWYLIEGKVVNNAHALLFTCEAERQLAQIPFKPYHPKRELVVGLGVEAPPPYAMEMNVSFFKRCPELINQPYLLFLSRIHEKKGVDLLLKAYSKLKSTEKESADGLESFPKLVVAGPGIETDYGKKILELVNNDSFLKKNVFFVGMLSGNDKWGAFYGCEAFLLPSHQENFGIAVVEALACGKPVLISNQVNIWSEIKDAGAGFVESDTLSGTYKMMKAFIHLNKTDKAKMNDRARFAFENFFAVGPSANKLFKAIFP